jgi:SAM-dependent methyltransferase
MLHNPVTAETQRLYNETQSGDFSYGTKRDLYDALLFEFLRHYRDGQRVVDVGCGPGFYLGAAVRHGIPVRALTGIDLAPSNTVTVRANGFKVVNGDNLALGIRDGAADLTISSGVIHHTADPFRAFTELVRITRPGGLIYLNVYNKLHPYYWVVHKATAPLRRYYWSGHPRVADALCVLGKPLIQAGHYLAIREFVDDRTVRKIVLDQVMSPRADLFSSADVRRYAERTGCEVLRMAHNRYYMMLAAIIRVGGR